MASCLRNRVIFVWGFFLCCCRFLALLLKLCVLHQYIFTLCVFKSSAFCCANPRCLLSSKIVFITHSFLSPASSVYLRGPFPLPGVGVDIVRNYCLLRGTDPSKHLRIIEGKLGLKRQRCFHKLKEQRVKERRGCSYRFCALGRAGTYRSSVAAARIGLLSVLEDRCDISFPSIFHQHFHSCPRFSDSCKWQKIIQETIFKV